MDQEMFHTQEDRKTILTEPIRCKRKDAWLGHAFYFWDDETDAIRWGYDSKGGTFQVYSAQIKSDQVLDTVFNKEHYDFFIKSLERVANESVKKTGRKLTKQQLCAYLNKRAKWVREIDVLLFNDTPVGEREIIPIPARKRIQAAVYNINCVHNFNLKESYA